MVKELHVLAIQPLTMQPLYMLDEHYTRVKHKSTLHFLSKLSEFRFKTVRMAIE